MRQMRPQKPGTLYVVNKQNEISEMNLPYLKASKNKQSFSKNEFKINLNQKNKSQAPKDNKKTYLNLCMKKKKNSRLDDAIRNNKLTHISSRTKMTISTARVQSENSIITESYFSSRPDKLQIKKKNSNGNDILSRHKINRKMRAKMIDWLLQIHQAYNLKQETLFLAIFLLDQYFKRSFRSLALTQLHIIGVTALFMAIKYEQIHPIRLRTVYKQIGHCKLPIKDIIQRQSEIFETLNFCLKRQCPFLKLQEILYILTAKKQIYGNLKEVAKCYLKIACFDITLYHSNQSEILAKACILASIRSAQNPLNLNFYDDFSSLFGQNGKDYNKLQQTCSKIIFLASNFQNQYGYLDNICKQIKENIKNIQKKMIASCAL